MKWDTSRLVASIQHPWVFAFICVPCALVTGNSAVIVRRHQRQKALQILQTLFSRRALSLRDAKIVLGCRRDHAVESSACRYLCHGLHNLFHLPGGPAALPSDGGESGPIQGYLNSFALGSLLPRIRADHLKY